MKEQDGERMRRATKGDPMKVVEPVTTSDTPIEEAKDGDETVQLPGVIAALGEMKPGAVITEEGVAGLFGRCATSVKRAVQRGELPPPCRLFGSNAWTVGVLVGHIERRLEQAAEEARQLASKIRKLNP
jgi:hypothetical protein